MDGIEATRAIVGRTAHLATKIIILTTFDLDEYVYEALRAGASGFLLKDTDPDTLLEAIRIVASGDALLAPSVTRGSSPSSRGARRNPARLCRTSSS